MEDSEKQDPDDKKKREKLNFILLLIGVLIAGISFAWHILPIFFKK